MNDLFIYYYLFVLSTILKINSFIYMLLLLGRLYIVCIQESITGSPVGLATIATVFKIN